VLLLIRLRDDFYRFYESFIAAEERDFISDSSTFFKILSAKEIESSSNR
jgi:hypothetical protein